MCTPLCRRGAGQTEKQRARDSNDSSRCRQSGSYGATPLLQQFCSNLSEKITPCKASVHGERGQTGKRLGPSGPWHFKGQRRKPTRAGASFADASRSTTERARGLHSIGGQLVRGPERSTHGEDCAEVMAPSQQGDDGQHADENDQSDPYERRLRRGAQDFRLPGGLRNRAAFTGLSWQHKLWSKYRTDLQLP